MGVLDRFEKGVERAVNSAFAKAFRSEVQPVEVASALRRECDTRAAVVGRDRTLVPNQFVVELGPADHERIREWQDALAEELQAVVTDHARQQRYGFVGNVTVAFEEAEDLDTGVFRVRSALSKHSAEPPAGSGLPDRPPPGTPLIPRPGAVDPMPAAPPSVVLELNGQQYPLTASVTVLGRSPDIEIPLDDPGVSRRHAEIRLAEGIPRIVDLGSTNGTFVDGERVQSGVLRDGSVITVGRSRLLVRYGPR